MSFKPGSSPPSVTHQNHDTAPEVGRLQGIVKHCFMPCGRDCLVLVWKEPLVAKFYLTPSPKDHKLVMKKQCQCFNGPVTFLPKTCKSYYRGPIWCRVPFSNQGNLSAVKHVRIKSPGGRQSFVLSCCQVLCSLILFFVETI